MEKEKGQPSKKEYQKEYQKEYYHTAKGKEAKLKALDKFYKNQKIMPTVYMLLIDNQYSYIGSTRNLYNRVRVHKSMLAGQYHPNYMLQEIYNNSDCPDIQIVVLGQYDDVSFARQVEKALISKYRNDVKQININN